MLTGQASISRMELDIEMVKVRQTFGGPFLVKNITKGDLSSVKNDRDTCASGQPGCCQAISMTIRQLDCELE